MIEKMIREARSQRASDIHISEGQAVYLRIDGKLIKSDLELSDEMTRKLILSLLTKERQESIWRGEDADFALETSDGNKTLCYPREWATHRLYAANNRIPLHLSECHVEDSALTG